MKPNLKIFILLTLCYLLFAAFCNAQTSVKDSAITFPMIKLSYAFQIPGGDLAKRFGDNSNITAAFSVKTKHNLIFGADISFFFSSQVEENGILDSLSTSSGFIINQDGTPATVRMFERGFTYNLYFGKMFHLFAPNPNSGIVIYGGPTYMWDKIAIQDIGHQTPALSNIYLKGYDRLTAGFGLNEFIGYMYFGNSRIINFFGGLEFIQGFTKNLRRYDYDLRQPDASQKKDFLFGVRVGWIIPLYKKLPQNFYYY